MQIQDKNTYVAIMAGGVGSRFWPESRNKLPKQFLDILGTGKSLIQWTYQRFLKLVPADHIYIITSESYIPKISEQLPDMPLANILAEPSRKNTAPCAAYVSYKLKALNPDAKIIMSPADHLIMDEAEFENTIANALESLNNQDALITLGIKPSRPDTGYGYIQYDDSKQIGHMYQVRTFTEKPSMELAETFILSGDFLWNAGIFIWSVNSVIAAIQHHLPEMHDLFSSIEVYNTNTEKEAIERIYPMCQNISIDYGFMEKSKNVYVVPSYFGWCDLGTWNSAYENHELDKLGNACIGDNILVIDANRCMVKAPNDKLVVLQGLENYIVVDTEDVLLICERSREQQIKEYVNEVKRKKGDKYL
jgi:mannose-1-phosphate guanylyltransferase